MHGNVWEWCLDWFAKYPRGRNYNLTGPETGWSKIRRGGSWRELPFFCRSSYRSLLRSETKAPDLGFRLVLTIPDKSKQNNTISNKSHNNTCNCLAIKDILFDLDSSQLREDAIIILDEILKVIENKNVEIYVIGYTCDRASEEYNLKLSKKRAEAVKNYLVNHGIKENMIHISYYGEKYPKLPNTNEDYRKLNRRVEIKIFEVK